jgi:hypothetical protein
MVLIMPRCSMVGKWTGGAVGAGKEKLIGEYKVWAPLCLAFPFAIRRFLADSGVERGQNSSSPDPPLPEIRISKANNSVRPVGRITPPPGKNPHRGV